MSTNIPGDLFQGTFEVLEKKLTFARFIIDDIDDRFIARVIKQNMETGNLPFASGEITKIETDIHVVRLFFSWKLCYIEVDEILSNIKADIWDEGFDIEYGPMLILKGLENGH